MPAGSSPENSLEVLQSVRLNALMAQLTEWFDAIIIDSPPILPLADTSVWMRSADGIILVARKGITEKKQLQKGLEAIVPPKVSWRPFELLAEPGTRPLLLLIKRGDPTKRISRIDPVAGMTAIQARPPRPS